MTFPSPDNMAGASAWDNFVTSSAAQAALGKIPTHAHAVGVAVDGTAVRLCFQLEPNADDIDLADILEIADELSDLLGDDVDVSHGSETLADVDLSRGRDVYWIFKARLAEP